MKSSAAEASNLARKASLKSMKKFTQKIGKASLESLRQLYSELWTSVMQKLITASSRLQKASFRSFRKFHSEYPERLIHKFGKATLRNLTELYSKPHAKSQKSFTVSFEKAQITQKKNRIFPQQLGKLQSETLKGSSRRMEYIHSEAWLSFTESFRKLHSQLQKALLRNLRKFHSEA